MDDVVIRRVEIAVRSIAQSPGRGTNSVIQNPDQRDFSGNTENSPYMAASSRTSLNIDQGRTDHTRNVENFEDGDFPVSGPICERQLPTHHNCHHLKEFHIDSATDVIFRFFDSAQRIPESQKSHVPVDFIVSAVTSNATFHSGWQHFPANVIPFL